MPKDLTINLSKNGGVCCRFWAEECVVYHELSGQTHLIDETGAYLFKAIFEHPLTRSQLFAHLTSFIEFPIDFDLEGFLDKRIIEYQNLGLLEVTENQQP